MGAYLGNVKSENLTNSEEQLADCQLWRGALRAFDSGLQSDHDCADVFVLAEHDHLDVGGTVEKGVARASIRSGLRGSEHDLRVR